MEENPIVEVMDVEEDPVMEVDPVVVVEENPVVEDPVVEDDPVVEVDPVVEERVVEDDPVVIEEIENKDGSHNNASALITPSHPVVFKHDCTSSIEEILPLATIGIFTLFLILKKFINTKK